MKSSSPSGRSVAKRLRAVGLAALSLLYPPHCAHCRSATRAGQHLCRACRRSAQPVGTPRCEKCSEPFFGAITGAFTCQKCRERRFAFTFAVAPYRAQGMVREYILRFKYQRHFYLRHELTHWLRRGLRDERLRAEAPEFAIPVPLHSARRRAREFNQAEELALLLARRGGPPVLNALERIRFTTTQE